MGRHTRRVSYYIGAPVRVILRSPIFYCLVSIAVLWGLGLFYACQEVPAWKDLTYLQERVIVMCIILGFITGLSLLPVMVYVAFNRLVKERAIRDTLSELSHYNMLSEGLEEEIIRRFDFAYAVDTYKVPLPLATLAMQVGWVLFFFSQGPDIVPKLAVGEISVLFVRLENSHPVVFGFLGAFFFSLQMLLQRYITADLKASVFMHITVRIWVVIILTMVLASVWTWPGRMLGLTAPPELLAISFIAGIFPNVALDLIRRGARPVGIKLSIASPTVSMDTIQGMNLWNQARLTEEGIDSVQNLAMSDIIGLIANTRLGLMRLLHWVDQAMLIVHVGKEHLDKFRKVGIRSATDFESVYFERQPVLTSSGQQKRPVYVPDVPDGLIKAFKALEKEEGFEERVRNMMTAIWNDDNFKQLRMIRRGQLFR